MPSAIEKKNVTRMEILEMMSKKKKLEQQLKTLADVLQAHHIGMDESLVDAQDFPRNDIDVYQISITRNLIIRTRNDLKAIMNSIEKSLNTYFTQSDHEEAEHIVNGNYSLKPNH